MSNPKKISNLKKIRHYRVRKKIEGTLERPRLSVHKTHKYFNAQIIDDTSSKTLTAVSPLESQIKDKLPSNKTQMAKELGTIIAERAKTLNISYVVFDRGGFKYHGRIKSFAENARKGGLLF